MGVTEIDNPDGGEAGTFCASYDQDVLDVYQAFFDLYYHVSWIDERKERITYIGDGGWRVESDVSINLARLRELSGAISTGDVVFAPVVELQKMPRDASFEARYASGRMAKVAPDEWCYMSEWLTILGCVVHSARAGLLAPKEGYSRGNPMLPSEGLAALMREEIGRFAPNQESPDAFLRSFEERVKANGVEDEWEYFKKDCPGFLELFLHFVYNWMPALRIDMSSSECEVVSIGFVERFFRSKLIGEWKADVVACFRGRELIYPLRRIGTAESESFTLVAPEWTLFLPFEKGKERELRFCTVDDWSKAYASGEEESGRPPKPMFDIDGMLTENELLVHACTVWDADADAPRRRIDLPGSSSGLTAPSEGWDSHSMKNKHSYTLRVGWRARPGKRGKAYQSFLLVSFLSAALLLAKNMLCGAVNFWDTSNFLTALCILVPLLALVFSNLQEETPYYRRILMRLPEAFVRIGIACDVALFGVELVLAPIWSTTIFCLGSMAITGGDIVVAVAVVSFLILLVVSMLMFVWNFYNGEPNGENKKWYQNGALFGKIEVVRIPDELMQSGVRTNS